MTFKRNKWRHINKLIDKGVDLKQIAQDFPEWLRREDIPERNTADIEGDRVEGFSPLTLTEVNRMTAKELAESGRLDEARSLLKNTKRR